MRDRPDIRRRARRGLASIPALALALAGCDDPVRPGTLELAWRTGQLTCAEAGVSAVRAELYGYGAIEPVREVEQGCPEGGTVLDDVVPGEYTVLLAGLDPDGCWTHQAREDITVGDGARIALTMPLLRRARPLWVRWPFENDFDCEGNGVEQVQITIDVEDRFTWSDAFVCPGLAIEIPVEVPPGDLAVRVVGLDGRQRPVAVGALEAAEAVFTDTPCDDRIELRVPLSLCVSPGCEREVGR